LVDPLDVWTSGRTVQCDACGQRWRAVGEGVRPEAETEPQFEPEPQPEFEPQPQTQLEPEPQFEPEPQPVSEPQPLVAEEPSAVGSLGVEAETPDESAVSAPESPGPHEEPTPPVEAGESRRDWHAGLTEAAPPTDLALTREALLRKPPPPQQRLTSSFASPASGASRWLAVVFLVMLAVAAVVMFRDVIVDAFPGLAPLYASMGLLVHPAAAPHG
jgi:hypothetical protein